VAENWLASREGLCFVKFTCRQASILPDRAAAPVNKECVFILCLFSSKMLYNLVTLWNVYFVKLSSYLFFLLGGGGLGLRQLKYITCYEGIPRISVGYRNITSYPACIVAIRAAYVPDHSSWVPYKLNACHVLTVF